MDTAVPKGAQQSTMTNTGEQNSWVQCIYKMFLSTSLIGLQVLSWTSCKKVIHSIEQWNLSTADATGVLYGIPVGWFLFCWCCPWSSCKVSGSRGVGCMGGSEGRRGHCCTTICIQNWDALPVLKVVGWNMGKFKVEFDCIHEDVNQEDYPVSLPFHSRMHPSSPDEASVVPVTFHSTLHTWAPWWSKWAGCRTSSLVWPPCASVLHDNRQLHNH